MCRNFLRYALSLFINEEGKVQQHTRRKQFMRSFVYFTYNIKIFKMFPKLFIIEITTLVLENSRIQKKLRKNDIQKD